MLRWLIVALIVAFTWAAAELHRLVKALQIPEATHG